MTQEEKAKRYSDLLVKLQEAKVNNNVCDERYCCVIDNIVPELAESEDERIRKEIIDFLIHTNRYGSNERCESWLAWLGKQGEQKPDDMSIKEKAHQIAWETSKHYDPLLSKESWCEMAALDMASWLEKQGRKKPAWSKEDDGVLLESISVLQNNSRWILADKLKSLKDRVQPQQELSEEDEEHIESILKRLDGMCKKGATFTKTRFAVNQDMDWLKSLRPQKRWKPSEEQMEVLLSEVNAWTEGCPKQKVLESLYNDLKKLMGE